MKKEEHTEKITQIKEKVHDTDTDGYITGILADLSLDYGTILAKMDDINLQNEKLKKDNENLRDTNMQLFLKVGGDPERGPTAGPEEPTKPKEYKDLFDENGELK